MAGHSKWNNIKRKKGVADAKKAKVFSQLSKLIKIAVREGKSGDPKSNPTLRLYLEKARLANMPRANIDRAIERGLGKSKSGAEVKEYIYEAFGPGGVGSLIIVQTENTQRTAAEVRLLFDRAGGALAGPGSAMYLFQRQGEEYVPTMPMDLQEDVELLEKILDLEDGLRALDDVEDVFWATTLPEIPED